MLCLCTSTREDTLSRFYKEQAIRDDINILSQLKAFFRKDYRREIPFSEKGEAEKEADAAPARKAAQRFRPTVLAFLVGTRVDPGDVVQMLGSAVPGVVRRRRGQLSGGRSKPEMKVSPINTWWAVRSTTIFC